MHETQARQQANAAAIVRSKCIELPEENGAYNDAVEDEEHGDRVRLVEGLERDVVDWSLVDAWEAVGPGAKPVILGSMFRRRIGISSSRFVLTVGFLRRRHPRDYPSRHLHSTHSRLTFLRLNLV